MHLYGSPERVRELMRSSRDWPSLALDPGQIARLELLLDGSLQPLARFMTREMVAACLAEWRLPDGAFWPVPITLDVPRASALPSPGATVVLRDQEGSPVAVLHADDRWPSATADIDHVGGRVEGVAAPRHYDFRQLRLAPEQVRVEIARRAWPQVVAVQTERPPHPEALSRIRSAVGANAGVLVQAVAPPDAAREDRYYRRIRRFQAVVDGLGHDAALLTLLPFAADRRQPRGAALAAIVARNCGCSHVALDHGLVPGVTGIAAISTGDLGAEGDEDAAPPRDQQGFTVFFTGLSGSGKSTIANALRVRLLERGDRRVTLLDGDVVRQHLSSELGFSREHRELNVRRIGFVAAEITKHGGVAICAPIAPYHATRHAVREAIEAVGGFVLVFVDTPLEECERRDPKGLYVRARAGIIPEFTGVSDPYEPPSDAELVIPTADLEPSAAVDRIIAFLEREGYLPRSHV